MSGDSTLPWRTLMATCQDAKVAVIAAPYMKVGTLEQLLTAMPADASVTCVSRWTPEDIRSGVTDLACRQLILSRDGAFLLHDRLHAKYYRFDDQVLVGSSNLTRTGMNVDGFGNLEILCASPADFDDMQFEQQLLQGAYPVSDSDFALWSRITPIPHRNQTISLHNDLVSTDGWKPTTRRPEYLWLVYRQRGEDIPVAEQQEIASREVKTLGIPDGLAEQEFNDWVRLMLMTSPFVKSVLTGSEETTEEAWDRLSRQWNISKAEAERHRSTTHNWIAYFGLDALLDETKSFEAD